MESIRKWHNEPKLTMSDLYLQRVFYTLCLSVRSVGSTRLGYDLTAGFVFEFNSICAIGSGLSICIRHCLRLFV